MLDHISSRAARPLILVSLAVLAIACSKGKQNQASSENLPGAPKSTILSETATIATPSSTFQPATSVPNEPNSFELGLDKAAGAFSISQTAQSISDWNLVVAHYQDAITLMKQVKRDSPYFNIAQTKIGEYERQAKYAQQKTISAYQQIPQSEPQQIVVAAVPQAKKVTKVVAPAPTAPPKQQLQLKPPQPRSSFVPTPVIVETAPETSQSNLSIQKPPEEVFTTPIKRRMGGTPVIEVTFNGNQKFEMIVDTGASGTVITQKMANALGVVPVGKAKANTASSKAVVFPIGYINSMEVNGVKVNQTAVAIAGAELETGLLGHDFFGNYDITIKRDTIEFRPHVDTVSTSVETRLAVPIYPKQNRFEESPSLP